MEANVHQTALDEGGFVTEKALLAMSKSDEWRLFQVLVRCGSGRFHCPAQDAIHFIAIITKEGSDYVRDVGLLATVNPGIKLSLRRFIAAVGT
jgi:hypothetical protein